ncbi:hypothetical protein ACFW04_009069 [Cataglyphis niger]
MINSTGMIARQARQFMTSAIRRGGHHDPYDGIPGYNLPFNTQDRHRLLAYFMVYLGSGFCIPLFMVRHQLLK